MQLQDYIKTMMLDFVNKRNKIFNPFLANIPIFTPQEDNRKLLVFWYFQQLQNGNIGQKLVNLYTASKNLHSLLK